MKKRIILMSMAVALAAGAAFATSSKSGDKIYEEVSGCPEITNCTITDTGNMCQEADLGYKNANCTTVVTAFQRP